MFFNRLFILFYAKFKCLVPLSEDRHREGFFAKVEHLRPLCEAGGSLGVVGTLCHNLQQVFCLCGGYPVVISEQSGAQIFIAFLAMLRDNYAVLGACHGGRHIEIGNAAESVVAGEHFHICGVVGGVGIGVFHDCVVAGQP